MPTELPNKTILSTASTTEGTMVFAIAVLLMLVISTAVLLHPVRDRSADDISVQSGAL